MKPPCSPEWRNLGYPEGQKGLANNRVLPLENKCSRKARKKTTDEASWCQSVQLKAWYGLHLTPPTQATGLCGTGEGGVPGLGLGTRAARAQGLLAQPQCSSDRKASRALVEEVALLLGLGQAVLAVQVVHPHPLGAALGAAGAGERPGPALGLAGVRPLLSVPITGQ